MSTTYHVALTGSDTAVGSEEAPFRSINHAAQVALPGDTVVVHEGTYRECVEPAHSGLSDQRRITYLAAPGEHVIIKGSEVVEGWTKNEDGTWSLSVDNSLFGDFNPFVTPIEGDWVVEPYVFGNLRRHLGQVYLDGVALYEADSREDLHNNDVRTDIVDHWTGTTVATENPEITSLKWFAEVTESTTELFIHVGDRDPNTALTEINVRKSVFWPREHHINWITVRGFELAQAAPQWAPPTAFQEGLIGPNWAKGWIIEDNIIHDSKCVGISIGKERSSGDNYATYRADKPGYQYQLESVFLARHIGWSKERIGSHIIRRNHIYDCGQAGVVGHLGCVFSTIEDNHIHNIALRREFWGHEIGGIKLHAAIDTKIAGNHIHDTSLGIWLDWQTQGTRVTRNVLDHNCRDIFIEVSHGPYVLDHNVFASPASIEVVSQGGAFVKNLVGGTVRLEPVMDRATPYHLPHSTEVSGFALIAGGDDRWIGNIFFGGNRDAAYAPGSWFDGKANHGLVGYAEYPESFEEYMRQVGESKSDHERYYGRKLPVYANSNVYCDNALPYAKEKNATVLDGESSLNVHRDGDAAVVTVTLPSGFASHQLVTPKGSDLPRCHFPDVEFEETDGSPVSLSTDLMGETAPCCEKIVAGPINTLADGVNELRIFAR